MGDAGTFRLNTVSFSALRRPNQAVYKEEHSLEIKAVKLTQFFKKKKRKPNQLIEFWAIKKNQ